MYAIGHRQRKARTGEWGMTGDCPSPGALMQALAARWERPRGVMAFGQTFNVQRPTSNVQPEC